MSYRRDDRIIAPDRFRNFSCGGGQKRGFLTPESALEMLCDTAHKISLKKTGFDFEETKVGAVQELLVDLAFLQDDILSLRLTVLI